MREDLTRELLRRADSPQSEAGPASTEQILRGVQTRVRRRAARRVAGGALATVLLVAALSVGQRMEPAGPEIVSGPRTERTPAQEPAESPRTFRDYAAEADLRAALARRMAAGEAAAARIRELRIELSRPLPDLRDATQVQVELAAATLFHGGERVRSQVQAASAGCRQYRAVIDVYPETAWAQLARRRLADCPGS